MKEYIYEATIRDADTDELIVKVSGFSEESLEEEMGKTKWTGAIERYEADQLKEKELNEEDLKEANEELDWDSNQDKKLEEELTHKENL